MARGEGGLGFSCRRGLLVCSMLVLGSWLLSMIVCGG